MEYTIRFQNTGNDTAFNIEILDTLDVSVLDPTTFQSGVSSHPYTVSIYDNAIVKWRFENILLPDSFVNEPASNGLMKFQIQTRPNLPNGTVINNSAAIYFDYNAAIITNTSLITVDDQQVLVSTFEDESEIEIEARPNPFAEHSLISWNESILNGTVRISDISGRTISEIPVSRNQLVFNRNDMESGIYFLTLLKDDKPKASIKLVIQ